MYGSIGAAPQLCGVIQNCVDDAKGCQSCVGVLQKIMDVAIGIYGYTSTVYGAPWRRHRACHGRRIQKL